jgi:hypothetical protein
MTTTTRTPRTTRRQVARRSRTPQARVALAAFRRLGAFYGSDADLGRALGMSAESIRAWRRKPPLRPRAELRERIVRLLRLCLETQPYMDDALDVGQWTLAPNPRLGGQTPAGLVLEHGDGLRLVLAELVDLTSRREAAQIELPAGDELRAALADGLDDKALAEVERMIAGAPSAAVPVG